MRLLPNEHDDILELLEKCSTGHEVLFVKKKGWIHVEAGKLSFSFHRKKLTTLAGGKFYESKKYYYRVEEGETHESENWEEVRQTLEELLKRWK